MKKITLLIMISIFMFFNSCDRQDWSEYENGELRFVEHWDYGTR